MKFNNESSIVSDEDVALYDAYYDVTGDKNKVIEALLFYYGEDTTRRIVQDSQGKRIVPIYKDGAEDRITSIKYIGL